MENKKEIFAGIIIIGNEILSGRTQDTNTSTLSIWLNSLGIKMRKTNCFTPEFLSPEYLPDEIKKELPKDTFVQNILNNNEFNIDHCREFIIYTKYLETFQKAPEEALFVYQKLKEYV